MTSQRTRDRLVERLRAGGIYNERVLELIRNTPRHLFVDEALASRAYEDTALPIGHGQTISQPFVVARMTEALLENCEPRKVLEIGTGCGYQTAILAQCAGRVYTMERIKSLLDRARKLFRKLGLRNIRCKHGDGAKGWPINGPYDGIIVAAAPADVPQALIEQLADEGCLVIPVGRAGRQELLLIRKRNGQISRTMLNAVSFVPLLGGTA
ncbi:MAG: protein-L-isoaspartate(D-aspartate) O-methyltransferase [Gammaproteobacteria bacterium]|nr:protein-L-isoaspartate(D-aspartate) O-methyltransferase [Gammaproteobacteria bacterium]